MEISEIVSELEEQRRRIERALVYLRGAESQPELPPRPQPILGMELVLPKRRHMSAAGRAAIARAARLRWKRYHASEKTA